MASYQWKKKALLAKVETVYGTDAVPTGVANAMQGMNVELTPLDGDSISRDIELPYFGHNGELMIKSHVSLSFDIEMAGSGAAGTAPAYAPLLRGCGHAETLTASVKAEYARVSTAFESLSIYFHFAGSVHKMIGSRGSVRAAINANGLPVWRFTFKGLLVATASAALPALTLTGFKNPQVVNKINTTIFSVHGFNCIAQSFEADWGNQIEGRFLIGAESIEIVDSKPTGSVVIESPDITAKDFFAIATNRTRAAVQVKHGVGAGNIIQFDAPAVEIGRPSYSQDQGVVMMTLPLIFAPVAGNDELKVAIS
ncbi:phage tail tube protein [Dongia sp.]|uniref:phage tail tube protein n=1 Tax=Dongia sp. TaxID=1977262 RepID=UPI0035B19259